MLDNELHDRESHDNTQRAPGARDINPAPAVPAAVFQPPQVVFQPPAARPESAAKSESRLRPGRIPRVGRKPQARRDPRTRRIRGACLAMAPATMTTAPARDGAAGGVRAAPAAGPVTRTPRPRAPTQRRSRRTASQARTPPPGGSGSPAGTAGGAAPPGAARPGSSPDGGQGESRRSSSRSRSRRAAKSGAGGDGTDAQADAPAAEAPADDSGDGDAGSADADGDAGSSGRRWRKRRRGSAGDGPDAPGSDDPPDTVVHVREPNGSDDVPVKGSTRLEAKKQRRREGRETGRRLLLIVTESEFLARRESVEAAPWRSAQRNDRTQIAVLEERRAGRAQREPVQPPVLRRQRLPGQAPERAAVDGGRLRGRRQGPQRGALRRRGKLRRQRPRRASPSASSRRSKRASR